jgi:hypothetical protein
MVRGGLENVPVLGKVAAWRRQSLSVRPADQRVDGPALESYLCSLGPDGSTAMRLDREVDAQMPLVAALSAVTSPMALDYLERLERPIPTLSSASGVQIVTRSYMAHVVVEADPEAFGTKAVSVFATFPPMRRAGVPPQDLVTRVVKATRRNFDEIRNVSSPVWQGYVRCLSKRAHDHEPVGEELLAIDVIDALARFGWVLRQVDVQYGLHEERRRPDPG